MAGWRYRFDEAGLLALLRWSGATPWVSLMDTLKEAAARGWMEPVPDGQDERLVAVEAALRALAAVEPLGENSQGTFCFYCGGVARPGPGLSWVYAHTPDCPWLSARRLLGLDEQPGGEG